MDQHSRTLLIAGLGTLVLVAILFFGNPKTIPTCFPIPTEENQDGTQGYRIWSGESLKSFNPSGNRTCIPPGWQPVGEVASGSGWAEFAPTHTGVVINTSEFASTSVPVSRGTYQVTMLYPRAADPGSIPAYNEIVTHAFNEVSALFPDEGAPRAHTVLVTAGLAGNTVDVGTRVYPDPGPNATMLVRTPEQPRSGELFIHAVMHLYNRERPDLDAYEQNQAPLAPSDWQELEAAWSETAFTSSATLRAARIAYLYSVHTAVQTKNFSLIREPPFNDKTAFAALKKNIVVPENASYLDEQYGHYILAPLVMIGIDGLLRENHSTTSVEKLLTEIHRTNGSFFDALATVLPPEKISEIKSWMNGAALIPLTTILEGEKAY